MKIRFAVATLLVALGADARTFVSERCGVSFDIPRGWLVVAKQRCEFGLRPTVWPPPNETDMPGSAIEIRVTRQRFEDAAHDAFFVRSSDSRGPGDPDWDPHAPRSREWIVGGRLGVPFDAYWLRSTNWFGLIGASQIGYRRPSDPHATALGPAYRAVLSTGFYCTAVFLADNPLTGRDFTAVVQSFRFR